MIFLFLLILIWTNASDGSHFNGGTITWAPVYPNSNSSSVLITVTQTYSWAYPTISCLTNVPTSSGGFYTNTDVNLTCVGNCTTQGGYSSQPIDILTDCISFSASLGMLTSGRSHNITLNQNTYFWIAYRGQYWRTLENAATGMAAWSIVSLIDLIRRPDGLINTPPVATVSSPQYVIVNRTTSIPILVSDVNVGDDIRCRWSLQNSSYGVNECADVCNSVNMSTIANLSNCMLTFTPTISNVWYAITLQVEDFINTTSMTAMSSVPVQFLIEVLPIPNCSISPVIIPLTGCLGVQVNVSVSFTLYIMNYCNRTQAIISDLISTEGITGMTVSNLVNSTTNTSLSYVTLTWTPQTNQIGSQQFCAIAYTNGKVQSNEYCATFTVMTSNPCATTTTSTTSTTTSTTTAPLTTVTTTTETITTVTTATTATVTITTTVTTATTTIATLVTTTIQTTTSSSNQSNLTLIVGLLVFGLLLTLGCCCFWLYYLKWSAAAQRRRLQKIKKHLRQQTYGSSTREDITKIRSNKRSQNYFTYSGLNDEESLKSSFSNNPIETMATSTNGNERINIADTIEMKRIAKPPKEENKSIKSDHQQHPDGDISTVENQPRSQRSSVTVTPIRKSSRFSKIIKANEPNQSPTFDHEENEVASTSLTKIRVVKLPRNKVSAASKSRAHTVTESSDRRIRSQSVTDDVNNDTSVEDISNQRPSRDKSINTVKSKEKSSRVSNVIKNNELNQSPASHHEENELAATSLTKIHVIKLPRNKVSAASKIRTNTVTESSDRRIRSQSVPDDVNNDTSVEDISNQSPGLANSINIAKPQENQISSADTSRNIIVKLNNVQNKQDSHASCSNIKDNNDMRKRASSFAGITVSKIKTGHKKSKPFVDHSMNALGSNNDKKGTSNRVTVVPVKKEQS